MRNRSGIWDNRIQERDSYRFMLLQGSARSRSCCSPRRILYCNASLTHCWHIVSGKVAVHYSRLFQTCGCVTVCQRPGSIRCLHTVPGNFHIFYLYTAHAEHCDKSNARNEAQTDDAPRGNWERRLPVAERIANTIHKSFHETLARGLPFLLLLLHWWPEFPEDKSNHMTEPFSPIDVGETGSPHKLWNVVCLQRSVGLSGSLV